ncbi:MAG: phosphoribosyltransferase [Gemmatimonadetes bacterium]|nr:phosphoribosyltransferase [Gemmatimonadota bacterium]
MSIEPLFQDRHAAGVALASRLLRSAWGADAVVLGMARGGVAVAAPIARALNAPLDTVVARKLGVPGIEEVAFGAIAEGDHQPVLDGVHDFIGLPRAVVGLTTARERREVARRVDQYRDGQPLRNLAGRTVIVVDDGLASGATLVAAGRALRRHRPRRLVAATPVASKEGLQAVCPTFDEVVALATPEPFGTVSDWYRDFSPVDDAAVRALLGRSPLVRTHDVEPSANEVEQPVTIPTGEAGDAMIGDLGAPRGAQGLVIFAHGGGSSRGSYRNRYLAARLRLAGWATLRVDLLLDRERQADDDGDMRFDIERITGRLLAATRWCRVTRVTGYGRTVLFGASTGAAAAMGVAAVMPHDIAGVVARGGRIDLAAASLTHVRAPSLLVVGAADTETLQRTRGCAGQLGGSVTWRTIRHAGHTFEEIGALGRVGEVVTSWLASRQRRYRLHRWMNAHHLWPGMTRGGNVAQQRA